jgi:flagella basal body P-ring formation protein FlgA
VKTVKFLIIFLATILFADPNDNKRIEMEIAKVYMDAYPAISIVSISAFSTIIAEDGNLKFSSIDTATVSTLKDRGQVGVVFKTPQGDLRKKIYRYTIDATIEASRTKTVIAKDQLIAPENIEPLFLKIGAFADTPLSPNSAINTNAKRFIPRGTILMQRDVGNLPDIRKGQSVSATYVTGGIEADVETVAMEDGQKGQIISLKSKTGKVLRAKVIGKDRAEIE